MPTNPHDQVKIINARIVDVESGTYYPPQTSLVIQDGKILSLPGLPGEQEHNGVDAEIDLQGKTLIPALFNTHCHIQFIPNSDHKEQQIAKNMSDCLDRGVTNVRDTLTYDMQGNRALKDKIARREIPGPRLHQAVHVSPIGGTYAPRPNLMTKFTLSLIGLKLIPYSLPASGVVVFKPDASEQDVRDAVDRAIDERGADAIKFCDQPEHFMTYKPGASVMTFKQLAASVDQSIKRGMPTTMHNVTAEGFRQGVKVGLRSLAHLPLDTELQPVDADDLLKSGTFIEPTVNVAYFMSYSLKGSPLFGHPEVERLDRYRQQTYQALIEEIWLPPLQPSALQMDAALRKGQVKVFGIFDISEPFRYYSKILLAGKNNMQLLLEHGAASRLGCGNDAGPTSASPASVHHELAMFDFFLNHAGQPLYSAVDMLRTATINSARSMGVDEKFGSIQTGKIADLVVLDGDPLQDFHLIGQPVQALFMDGNLVINRCGLNLTGPKA